jgi:A/G-specific adenine glycosylase
VTLFQERLLRWYDYHQRSLPWRAKPGSCPNPYHVWLSEIMLQQTTVATVQDYFSKFIEKWPRLVDLAATDLQEIYHGWQGLGYYSRAHNLHRCAQILMTYHNGQIPSLPAELLQLPGIGPYTSAAIAAIAFDYPILPVDGNIIRVISRLLGLQTALPELKSEVYQWAQHHPPRTRPGDVAQAFMDLGSLVCKPKNPQCHGCPLQDMCIAFKTDQQERIPYKKMKKQKPTRFGRTFICFNQKGEIQLQQRPSTGLLANLYEFPGTPWGGERTEDYSLMQIKHTFTHFHLILTVEVHQREDLVNETCFWVNPNELSKYALPTVMHKVWQLVVKNKEIIP